MSQNFEFSHLHAVVTELSTQVRKQDFLTYFKKFSLMNVTTDTVTLGVVSGFHRDNLSKKFYTEIKTAIQKIAPQIEAIDIIVDDAIDQGFVQLIDLESGIRPDALEIVSPIEVDGTEGPKSRFHLVIHKTYMGSPL